MPGFDLRTEFARAQFFVLFSRFVGLFLFWCFGCSRFIRAFFDVFSLSHGYRFKDVSSALFWQKTTHILARSVCDDIIAWKSNVFTTACTTLKRQFAHKAHLGDHTKRH